MRRHRQFSPTTHVVLGIMLAAIGVLFTLDNLQLLHAREFTRYWPVALIVVGIMHIAQSRAAGGWIGGALWIVIGAALLGNRLGYLHVNIWNFWPLFLVLIGGRMVAQAYYASPAGSSGSSDADAGAVTSAIAVLGRVDRKITSREFRRAEITAFMGGGKLDLRDATLAGGEAVINVLAVMGGFELVVPNTWNVVFEVTPFMGGIDDKRRPAATDLSAPRLILRGFVMMGGVEIKE